MYYVEIHTLSLNRYLSSIRLTRNQMAFRGYLRVNTPRCFSKLNQPHYAWVLSNFVKQQGVLIANNSQIYVITRTNSMSGMNHTCNPNDFMAGLKRE